MSFFTNPVCIGIAIVNSGILVAYAAKLKKMPLLGNITVAYLSGSIFLFGGAFSGWDGFIHMIPIAAITFFAMISRELFKAAEDIEGDKAGGADTLPLCIGIKKTSQLALISTGIAVAVSFIRISGGAHGIFSASLQLILSLSSRHYAARTVNHRHA